MDGRPGVIDTLLADKPSSVQIESQGKHIYWMCINYENGESVNLWFKNLSKKGAGVSLEHNDFAR